jgi:hypothetical protein
MRQVMRKGMITMAAATGVLAVTGGYAHADTSATGSGSPGLLSGNVVQAPVDIPVNVCGNTVNVLGVANPASGNACGNTSHGGGHSGSTGGHTGGSPGVSSGNDVQVPVTVPVNVCGNAITVGGLGNVPVGNDCANSSGGGHTPPPAHHRPPSIPQAPVTPQRPDTPAGYQPQGHVPAQGPEELAETGSALPLGATLTLSGGALLAGALIYRKARSMA